MKLLGQILLWAGFLVGSYLTVSTSTHEGVKYTKGRHPEMVRLSKEIAIQEKFLSTPDFEESEPEKFEEATKELKKLELAMEPLQKLQSALASKGMSLEDLSAVEVPENGWHLIPWIWYSIATAVCFAGVVLLHMSRKNTTEKSDKSAASLNEITQALERVIGNTKQLAAESSKLAPSKIVDRIDNVLANDLRIFAEGRDCMTTEHGLTVFADVMSPFAAGERAINRAWSAAADGYIDEATVLSLIHI